MKTGLVQQHNHADSANNIDRLTASVVKCAQQGAKLVVLQELHNNLYFCQTEDINCFDMAETIPGPSTDIFGRIAREEGVVIVTSLFEKRATGIYHNTAVVIDSDGSIAGIYRKMHIPDDPAYYEKFYFTPGDLGFMPVKTSVGTIGTLVCWDQWYPEAARLMAMKGAEIIIYPTAIGWDDSDTPEEKQRQLEAWKTIQRGHAIANGIPVVAVNRVGHEDDPSGRTQGIRFWGNSFVAGAQGEIIVELSGNDEEISVVDIDLSRTETVRRWWPFFRDRRIDAYGEISERFLI